MSHWLSARLLEDRVLDEQGLADLQAWPELEEAGLVERVWRVGLLNDRALLTLLEQQGARDGTALIEGAPPSPAALGALTRELAARCRAVPLQVARGRVVVGMLDPSDTSALEEMAFFTSLSVEPQAVRASVLFRALHEAYGLPLVHAEPDLKVRFAPALDRSGSGEPVPDEDDDVLPPPAGVRLPAVKVRSSETRPARGKMRVPDTEDSPLLSGIAAAAEAGFSGGPSTSPAISLPDEQDAAHDPEQALVGRDSLPPQVLPLLVPPFRHALLFLVRADVAVGWDGRAEALSTDDIRGVLLPLTADSAFQRARDWRMVAAGTARRPTTVERMLFRFLKAPAPETFLVVPILVGDDCAALLYVDRDRGELDDGMVARARQVGTTLADGLAPLVARGSLFGPQGS